MKASQVSTTLRRLSLLALLAAGIAAPAIVQAQGTPFTYQGNLKDGGEPATGSYDLRFLLKSSAGGTAIPGGDPIERSNVSVEDGVFTTSLDFGSPDFAFNGEPRWVEIQVRKAGAGAYQALSPRQPIQSTPRAASTGEIIDGKGSIAWDDDGNLLFHTFQSPGDPNPELQFRMASHGQTYFHRDSIHFGGIALSDNQDEDPDRVGLYFETENDTLRFNDHFRKVDLMALTDTGNLGIGTMEPATRLHVQRNSASEQPVNSNTTLQLERGDGHSYIGINTSDTSAAGMLFGRHGDSTHGGIIYGAEDNLEFRTGGNKTRLRIMADGTVRVQRGASGQPVSPQTGLLLHGNQATYLGINVPNNTEGGVLFGRKNNHAHGGVLYDSSESLQFRTGGNHTRLRITSEGKIGIGTDSPTDTLEVVGNVKCTTAIITSDRNKKDGFEPVDPREVLEKVAAMEISKWHYKTDQGVDHIGPVAQDFHAAFGLGKDDKHIASVDADGVALAAIQGLKEVVEEKDAQIRALERRLQRLEAVLVDRSESDIKSK